MYMEESGLAVCLKWFMNIINKVIFRLAENKYRSILI